MGQNKAELSLGGLALWQKQLQTLGSLGGDVLISGPLDGPWQGSPFRVVEDRWPGCGPLSGLATTLEQAKTRWVVVLAIDLPLVPTSFLAGLLAAAHDSGRGFVPCDGERFHPLAAVYPIAAAECARARVERGELALQPFVRALETACLIRPYPLSASEKELLLNINTPTEWQSLTSSSLPRHQNSEIARASAKPAS